VIATLLTLCVAKDCSLEDWDLHRPFGATPARACSPRNKSAFTPRPTTFAAVCFCPFFPHRTLAGVSAEAKPCPWAGSHRGHRGPMVRASPSFSGAGSERGSAAMPRSFPARIAPSRRRPSAVVTLERRRRLGQGPLGRTSITLLAPSAGRRPTSLRRAVAATADARLTCQRGAPLVPETGRRPRCFSVRMAALGALVARAD